jgi:hypothetical protein
LAHFALPHKNVHYRNCLILPLPAGNHISEISVESVRISLWHSVGVRKSSGLWRRCSQLSSSPWPHHNLSTAKCGSSRHNPLCSRLR